VTAVLLWWIGACCSEWRRKVQYKAPLAFFRLAAQGNKGSPLGASGGLGGSLLVQLSAMH
jgi:hypothetical protein